MKKIIVLLFVLMGAEGVGQVSNWQWARQATGEWDGSQETWSVATDRAGNVFTTGFFSDTTMIFGSTVISNSGMDEIFIAKYSTTGAILWAKSAGGINDEQTWSVTTDTAGNAYLTGSFQSPIIYFGNDTLNNVYANDVFIMKFAGANGNPLWARSGGSVQQDVGKSVTTDMEGNLYVTGEFAGTITFDTTNLYNTNPSTVDIFILKYSSNGNILWAKNAGGLYNDYSRSITTDLSGNIYLTGYFGSPTITFDTIILTNTGQGDMFIAKYNTNGDIIWAKSTTGVNNEVGYSVATDAFGNAYVAGFFVSPTITFDTISLTNSGGSDMFIVKYDTNGNVIWAKNNAGSGNEIAYSVATSTSGATSNPIIYVTGSFTSNPVMFGSNSLFFPFNYHDPMFVVEYDYLGNVICTSALSSGGDDYNAVATDGAGNAYVAGDFNGSPFILGSDTLFNGYENMFVAKYNCNVAMVSIKDINKEEKISIYPNPFTSQTTITFSEGSTGSATHTIKVVNVLGAVIQQLTTNNQQLTLDMSGVAKGIYFVEVRTGNEVVRKKLVKE